MFRVAGDFVSVPHHIIPDVIPSQNRHVDTGPIVNSYGVRHFKLNTRASCDIENFLLIVERRLSPSTI